MKIRLIGLGKMGANIALNLRDHQHQVIAYDMQVKDDKELLKSGVVLTNSYQELLKRDNNERVVVWLLVPNNVVDQVIEQVIPYLKKNDIIIDGGNSNYKESIRRFNQLSKQNIEFVDLGTSGGTYGARYGACLMVGGTKEAFDYLEEVYKDISTTNGYGFFNQPGAGHFVKMVHNGIEYGMMQAIAEGFELIEASSFKVDYEKLSSVWNHGSIISSALIGYTQQAFSKDPKLNSIIGRIDDSGEGKWMIEEALNLQVATPVIASSLFTRFKSRDDIKFAEKTTAAMRNQFGGHAVYKKDEKK